MIQTLGSRRLPQEISAHTRPLKVCHLLHSLQVGGAELLAVRIAREQQHACHFVFVCLDELGTLGQDLQHDGFCVEVLQRRAGLDWRCAWRFARLLRAAQVDVIHAHQYTPFFYSVLARMLYRHPRILFTEHGRHFPDYPRRKRIVANRLLLEKRDRVVGVGEAVRQALISNEGIPAERVDVIYNGIDTNAFTRNAHLGGVVRRELGLRANDFVMLMVARLDYLKDHATAIRTLGRVARHVPRAKLVLVGEGPERAKVETLISELRLTDHVRLLGLRKDVPRLLSAADAFLLTSISEGIPLTAIEAMASGLPVVATRVGGLCEVVEHGATGFLAPAGDDARLAACLLRLAHDSALRATMGTQGQDRARRVFSESEMHARYLDCYREMARS